MEGSRESLRLAAVGAVAAVLLAACGASASGAHGQGTAARPSSVPSSSAAPPAAPPAAPTTAAQAPATAATVDIINFKFTPAALTVKAGTTVSWTNKDTIAHTVNFTADGINSKVLNQNDQFAHTFTTPGTYPYICSIHPFMHGTVTVTA